jgi:branched-chain amino acid transport system substrate-binding protein
MDRGIEMYLKLNTNQVEPYTIKLIKRDAKNPDGADGKLAVQELLTEDKVDAVVGWIYSPNAIASAPLVTAANKLGVIMNAGTAWIIKASAIPGVARLSFGQNVIDALKLPDYRCGGFIPS